jgi:hypothetical protein
MSDIVDRLHAIRAHLRTGALGQREVWEEWLIEAAVEIARLRECGEVMDAGIRLAWKERDEARAEIARLQESIQLVRLHYGAAVYDNDQMRATLQRIADGDYDAGEECGIARRELDRE